MPHASARHARPANAVGIAGTILLFMPLFVVAFPVLAYASERAYRDVCA